MLKLNKKKKKKKSRVSTVLNNGNNSVRNERILIKIYMQVFQYFLNNFT